MSKFHQVKSGETLTNIAWQYYGDGSEASRIQRSNPVVQDPNILNTNWVLTIPDIPGSGENIEPSTPLIGGDKDEVSITIDQHQFYLWEETQLNFEMDVIDSFQFSIPWDPTNDDLKDIFKPYQYKQVGITIGGEKVITGTLIKTDPQKDSDSSVLTLSGYGKPGILQDVNAPTNTYPLEFFDNDLEQIAKTLCDPFSITPVFESDKGSAFKSVTLSPSEKILGFLVKLAKQRGLIVTSNAEGELVFQAVASGKAKSTIKEGLFPWLSGNSSFDGQKRFSTITAIGDSWNGKSAGNAVVQDNTISVNRSQVFNTNHITKGELQKAATARMGRSFADSIPMGCAVTGWRDVDGDLWEKNTKIIYQSPSNFIYKETELLIRSVSLTKKPNGLTGALVLVFPEAYNGEIRDSYPWD